MLFTAPKFTEGLPHDATRIATPPRADTPFHQEPHRPMIIERLPLTLRPIEPPHPFDETLFEDAAELAAQAKAYIPAPLVHSIVPTRMMPGPSDKEQIVHKPLFALPLDTAERSQAPVSAESRPKQVVAPPLTSLKPASPDNSDALFLENSMTVEAVDGVFDFADRPRVVKLLQASNVFDYFQDVDQLLRFVEFGLGFPYEYRPGQYYKIPMERLADAIRENNYHFLSNKQQDSLTKLIERTNEKYKPIETIR